MHAKWRRNFIEYKKNLVVYPQRIKEWIAGGRKGEKPRPPKGTSDYRRPGNLYNAMLSGLAGFPVKGLVIDQTEGNIESNEYSEFIKTLITDLHLKWGVKTLPTVLIQATNAGEKQIYPIEPIGDLLPRLREKQALLAKDKLISVVVTTDLKEKDSDLAVKTNAEKLTSRVVRAVKQVGYGDKTIVASGPTVKSIAFKGSKVIITFDNVGPGLIIKNSDEIKGFAIAGKDKKFYWAKVSILNKNTIVLQRRDKVLKPVAIRYNWAGNPIGNLYNKEALPVGPFRTDKWDDLKAY
jgi:sialate O-acetylesterase